MIPKQFRVVGVVTLSAGLLACGSSSGNNTNGAGPDAGTPDAGPTAGTPDAGTSAVLTVTKSGTGSGTVTVNGNACAAPSCANPFPVGTSVTIAATPVAGSRVGAWSGVCAGSAGTCSLTLSADTTIDVAFDPVPPVLTVTTSGSGTGSVTVNGTVCAAPCTNSFPAGTAVSIAATAATASQLGRWSSACAGSASTCSITLNADQTIDVAFETLPLNIVFATSTTYTLSTLGGLSGADSACAARAAAAGLPGTYVAWLSTTSTDAVSRLGNAHGWRRTDGRTFADTIVALTSGVTRYPPALDEFGQPQAAVGGVLTGTSVSGRVAPFNCADFTDATATTSSIVGNSLGASGVWTDDGTASCAQAYPIYCFGIDDAAVPISAPPSTTRVAFLSNVPYPSSGGLNSADAFCATFASAASQPGTYLAFLDTSTATADSRFDTTGAPWARPDGVRIVASASDLTQAQSKWLAMPDQQADAAYAPHASYWGRAGSSLFPATQTCQDWTSSSSADNGFTTFAAQPLVGTSPCDDITSRVLDVRLLCLQK